ACLLPVSQVVKQRFDARENSHGAGAHGKVLALRQVPAGILAAEAGKYGLGGANLDVQRPLFGGAHGELDLAKSAHADPGDAQTRLEAAKHLRAGINKTTVEGTLCNGYAQALGLVNHAVRDRVCPFIQKCGAVLHAGLPSILFPTGFSVIAPPAETAIPVL